MRTKAMTKDLYLALAVTLLGGVCLYVAMRARWNPQDINPGIEGCLVSGVLATIFALLSPMEYRRALLFSAPVVAIEYWACAFAGGPAVGIIGLHLIIIGFIGLGLTLRDPRPVAARAREAREAREGRVEPAAMARQRG